MKVLILGASGMIGHRMWAEFGKKYETYGVLRRSDIFPLSKLDGIEEERCFLNLDVTNLEKLEDVFKEIKPDIVLNCIGVIKQIKELKNSISTIHMNALFPHELAKLCVKYNSRMIQFSTDCVFSGKDGFYTEDSIPDALDIYGKSKSLGEVLENENVLTIRTSCVGREVYTANGLLEWFISRKNLKADGYSNAIFSGFPAKTLAKIIMDKIIPNKSLHGLVHIASKKINKYELLNLFNQKLDLKIEVTEKKELVVDRCLNSDIFNKNNNFEYIPWNELVKDLDVDQDFYEKYRF